ncbi:MAG: hypothetical protein IIY28_03400 [Lachnospiraceae bacterium]|nr:hypothetical protein [Lachnospiraceae bacterium]
MSAIYRTETISSRTLSIPPVRKNSAASTAAQIAKKAAGDRNFLSANRVMKQTGTSHSPARKCCLVTPASSTIITGCFRSSWFA